MALKDLLVSVDGGPRSAETVDVAVGLALRHDAHVTGVFGMAPVVPAPYAFGQVDAGTLTMQQRMMEERADAAEKLFRERVRRAGIESRAEWRAIPGHPIDVLSGLGRCADLVVMGQADPDREDGAPVSWPGEVLFGVGRPVLVVPWAGDFPTVGERVLVAWNGTRESARAIHDALPMLKRARAVTVLTIDPGYEFEMTEGELPDTDLARHLARHGVPVEASRSLSGGLKPWDLLLNQVTDTGADLIVMGAYGHSRLREFVFGGMTLSVLRHMTVPVLLSH